MNHELLVNNIRRKIDLSEKEQAYILELFTEKKLKRKQFILHEGQANHHVSFVVDGCLRAYSVDKNGFERILQFAPNDWWITDIHSFVTGMPASLNIDAIEESTILMITREDREKALSLVPKLERYFRILMEKNLAANRQRIIDRLSLTAKERFVSFCNTYPELINRIPQKQMASYIGVTPEFLSKMRSEYLRSLKH
ncbi:MAG: Crp/Fnr family transcriptional regulator [Candidatus Parvibacillus calidus]|nr:MAG: Crp/Fnr family transcriptional regulator [Candidatus Parvibacillus calidus]